MRFHAPDPQTLNRRDRPAVFGTLRLRLHGPTAGRGPEPLSGASPYGRAPLAPPRTPYAGLRRWVHGLTALWTHLTDSPAGSSATARPAGSGPAPLIAGLLLRTAGHARDEPVARNRADRGLILIDRSPTAMAHASLVHDAAAEWDRDVGPGLGCCLRSPFPGALPGLLSQAARGLVACYRFSLVVRALLQTPVAQAFDVSVWSG